MSQGNVNILNTSSFQVILLDFLRYNSGTWDFGYVCRKSFYVSETHPEMLVAPPCSWIPSLQT